MTFEGNATETEWQVFSDEEDGFEIEVPVKEDETEA